ncbi:unnamed protein product [Rotaria socialis]|uniref:Uncharacterized protein n=2 Tax=Rotaria socialis TaxID=392032 RepID=A0A820UL29_9BILA|nr:unnamed protein product [Rotaria socialis]
MLTLYVPLIVVNEDEHRRDKFPEKILIEGTEEESISFHSEPALVPVNYGQCCLWSKEIVATCGTLYLDYFDWKRQCYTFAYLAERDIRPHFQNLRVINKNILIDDSMSICPKYRSFFGIDWCDVLPRCNHPDDDSKYRPPASGCHRANLSMCSRIEGFTIGGSTYGLTTRRMGNGEKVELSKQILQSQTTHAIVDYKKYCEETDCERLSNRKLFAILSSLKPAQQRVLAGLNEFVVDGVEAWSCLSNIINGMSVPQADRKRLLKQIDLAEQYQKVIHSGHCSDNSNCITHCTTFGLSYPKCPEHQSKCTQAHTSDYHDCINISRTLYEIGETIKKISNEA